MMETEDYLSFNFMVNRNILSWLLNPTTEQIAISLTWDDDTVTFDSDTITFDQL